MRESLDHEDITKGHVETILVYNSLMKDFGLASRECVRVASDLVQTIKKCYSKKEYRNLPHDVGVDQRLRDKVLEYWLYFEGYESPLFG